MGIGRIRDGEVGRNDVESGKIVGRERVEGDGRFGDGSGGGELERGEGSVGVGGGGEYGGDWEGKGERIGCAVWGGGGWGIGKW